jgi:Uma2 family endonuclease
LSPRDYLIGEMGAHGKHEFVDGAVYAMVGASNLHNCVATNTTGILHAQLRGKPCRVFNSATKVREQPVQTTRFYYPDVSVVCRLNPAAE